MQRIPHGSGGCNRPAPGELGQTFRRCVVRRAGLVAQEDPDASAVALLDRLQEAEADRFSRVHPSANCSVMFSHKATGIGKNASRGTPATVLPHGPHNSTDARVRAVRINPVVRFRSAMDNAAIRS